MTDNDLIDAIRGGDREAFGVLVGRYQRMVEAAAYSATGRHDLVDDVAQDTFVTAWSTIDRLREVSALRPWLYGIAKHLGLKARRRAQRTPPIEVGESSPTQLDQLLDREREQDVAKVLARLPRRYREPLVLFYYEHCTVREVADALAMRESAVMQRLSRGRRKLGDRLASRVEVTLEHRKSALAAGAVLALLPIRSASAATAASAAPTAAAASASGPSSTLASPSAQSTSRSAAYADSSLTSTQAPMVPASLTARLVAGMTRRWRPIGGVFAIGGAALLLTVGVARSNDVHARQVAREHAAPAPSISPAPAPALPPAPHDEHDVIVTTPLEPTDDDPDHVYRVISLSSQTPYETCARGARAVVMAAYGDGAIQFDNGERYFRPSAELLQAANAAGQRTGSTCGGDSWPEAYVICEGTIADIEAGTVSCFPFDAFHDSL